MQAIRQEMDSRGYSYTEESPDLLVNFHTNGRVNDAQTQVRRPMVTRRVTTPTAQACTDCPWSWPKGRKPSRTEWVPATSTSSTRSRKVLVWEGIAEGRLSEEMIANPGPAIGKVISDMFAQYPGKAPK